MKIEIKVELNEEVVKKEKLSDKELEELVKFKNVQVHGYEVRDLASNETLSSYHAAFRELYNDWFTYQ